MYTLNITLKTGVKVSKIQSKINNCPPFSYSPFPMLQWKVLITAIFTRKKTC